MPLLVAVALVLLAAPAAAAAAERWRWPVRGEVVRPFAVGPHPYAAGQHRGIDIAARPGATVRAACSGPVRFAGRVPGRGAGVSVGCGPLIATHLGLARLRPRRGRPVTAGAPLGVARGGHVQLGARRAGERHGYVDPLALLAGEPPPLGPAPPAARRGPRVRPAPVPVRPRAPAVEPAPARAPPGTVPVAAWLGLGLLAAGLPLGGVVRTARRRRRARAGLRPVPR